MTQTEVLDSICDTIQNKRIQVESSFSSSTLMQVRCQICQRLFEEKNVEWCDCGNAYCWGCICGCTYAPAREWLLEAQIIEAADQAFFYDTPSMRFAVFRPGCRVIENEDGAYVWSSYKSEWAKNPPRQAEEFSRWVGSPKHHEAQQGAILTELKQVYGLMGEGTGTDVTIYPFKVEGEPFTLSVFATPAALLLPLGRNDAACIAPSLLPKELPQN